MFLWVEMDVIYQLLEVRIGTYQGSFKRCLEQCANAVLLLVKRHGIGLEKLAELVAHYVMGGFGPRQFVAGVPRFDNFIKVVKSGRGAACVCAPQNHPFLYPYKQVKVVVQ